MFRLLVDTASDPEQISPQRIAIGHVTPLMKQHTILSPLLEARSILAGMGHGELWPRPSLHQQEEEEERGERLFLIEGNGFSCFASIGHG